MKIAYFVLDISFLGGIERYTRELAAYVANMGHEVHIYSSTECNIPSVTSHKIKVYSFLPRWLKILQFQITLNNKFKDSYDIIHNQDTYTKYDTVVTAHSCHAQWVRQCKKESIKQWHIKTLYPLHWVLLYNEKRRFTKSKRITAVSQKVKDKVCNIYNVSPDKIDVIYPGISLKNTQLKSKEYLREELNIPANAFILLFVANEFKRKGLSVILKALEFANNKDIFLLIAGSGKIKNYLNLTSFDIKKVKFLGKVKDVSKLYAASDLLVLPTKHEAFGMVAAEAMNESLAVLVSKLAGVAEIIKDENCLLYTPGDYKELLRKINFFASNKNLAYECGQKLKTEVKKYSWEYVANKTILSYHKIANNAKQ
ncbi:MAG: glycosyltransferase family 4 protein [Endomicrobiales bacterium]|nr:glycosyltransferase family 4 protein [Endomicrobiales bacterium]